VFILKGLKVLCFDTLLQVLILKRVRGVKKYLPSNGEAGRKEGWGAGKE
jgi:hypothetical protein